MKEQINNRVKQYKQTTVYGKILRDYQAEFRGNEFKNLGKMSDFLKRCCQNWVMKEEVKNLKPITIETIYNISKDRFIIVKGQLCYSDILTSQVLAKC